ncbi:MAG: sigma-70 family RNA polymerase sigma factor, partial [Victivallales bacterium]|nr:sigma-70 family RNA polymerase sigma factor [Victivallales bacterium]
PPAGASALHQVRFVELEFAVVTTASFARLASPAHCLVQFPGYDRYKRQVYSFLLKMLAEDNAAADDLFQQIWIKTLRNLHRYRHRERFLAWLLSITRNTALDYFRRQRRNYLFSGGAGVRSPGNGGEKSTQKR